MATPGKAKPADEKDSKPHKPNEEAADQAATTPADPEGSTQSGPDPHGDKPANGDGGSN